MKKITLMIAALGTTLAFTACQDSADDHPVLGTTQGQVVEILNTPEGVNAPLQFTPENADGALHMTCSKPQQYGFNAPISYQVQVSLDDNFATPQVDGCPAAVVLPTAFQNNEAINPPYKEVAKAMRDMLDIQSTDQVPTPYYPLYIRLIANVITTSGQPYENTMLLSNTVEFTEVSVGYLDVVESGKPSGIFLRGGMNGWGSPSDWEFLSTSTPGVYEIEECEIAAGTEFKVADANWGQVNYGAGAEPIAVNTPYELVSGGGNIAMPVNFSGSVVLTVEGPKYTILFNADEPDTPGVATGLYIKGSFNGWSNSPESEFITTDIKGRWEIPAITITAGEFKVADANWGPINLGSNGEPIEPDVRYALVDGGGNIEIKSDFTGMVKIQKKDGQYYMTLVTIQ